MCKRGCSILKTLITFHSYHHHNTEKIGNVIAETLEADFKPVSDTTKEDLASYDLIGFGAGIDSGKHYKPMLKFAEALPVIKNGKAFLFSTSGIAGSRRKMKNDHKALREILVSKGYSIMSEFQCKGLDTNSFLKYFGGINKGKPSADDFAAAQKFAQNLVLESDNYPKNL